MKNTARSRFQNAVARPGNILCLTIDRLNPDQLGAYGAAWIDTPAFDALAAESILFDSFYATSLDRAALCRAFWRGEAPADFRLADPIADSTSIFRLMKSRGYRTYLLSDVESVSLDECVDGDDCDDRFLLDGSNADAPVESLEQTGFFKNFEELTRFLVEIDDGGRVDGSAPYFVWAHFSGWDKTWDFPMEERERFREIALDAAGREDERESDPPSYAGVEPPYWRRDARLKRRGRERRDASEAPSTTVDAAASANVQERSRLSALDESDRRQSVLQAYCGGVATFDETLGGFVENLKERGLLNRTLFALSGFRGFALGAPSALGRPGAGDATSAFYSEETRIPLLLRLPDASGATTRIASLCEPRDLFAALRDWPDRSRQTWNSTVEIAEQTVDSAPTWRWDVDALETAANPYSPDSFRNLNPDKPGQNLIKTLEDEEASLRDSVRVVAKDADSRERALVVDSWFLKRSPIDESELVDPTDPRERVELFVLPDDRYCVNDVADRCPDVAEQLQTFLDARR